LKKTTKISATSSSSTGIIRDLNETDIDLSKSEKKKSKIIQNFSKNKSKKIVKEHDTPLITSIIDLSEEIIDDKRRSLDVASKRSIRVALSNNIEVYLYTYTYI
jgi:Mg/Co/Ni transporter MgtE